MMGAISDEGFGEWNIWVFEEGGGVEGGKG